MASGVHIDPASAIIMVDGYVDQIDLAGDFKVFSGALPAECATADPSGLLVTIDLPEPAFAAAADTTDEVTAAKAGTWSGVATGAGNAACFRLYDGATCIGQGTAGDAGDTPDLEFDNKLIAVDATITVTTFAFALPYNPEG